MAFHLNEFNNRSQYDAFIGEHQELYPQVAHTIDDNKIIMERKPVPIINQAIVTIESYSGFNAYFGWKIGSEVTSATNRTYGQTHAHSIDDIKNGLYIIVNKNQSSSGGSYMGYQIQYKTSGTTLVSIDFGSLPEGDVEIKITGITDDMFEGTGTKVLPIQIYTMS